MRTDAVPTEDRPVQESWPELPCFGCGPANDDGLHLHSHLDPDRGRLVAVHEADDAHVGYPGVAYGGLVASLVDCNSMWTAMVFRNLAEGRSERDRPVKAYVTADLSVTYDAPTPAARPIVVESWVEGEVGERTTVHTEVGPEGEVTATGEVTAVAVDPDWFD